MADLSVHIFVQNLRHLMKSQRPNIAGKKDQLESLYKDVSLLSCFLKKIEEKSSFEDEKVNNLVTEIRELVLEAENIVDHFVVDELSLDLRSLHKQLEKVKIEVEQMNADQSTTLVEDVGKKFENRQDIGEMTKERSGDNLEAAVGIKETIDKILAGFSVGQEMEVISVVGLPGIGKTTLAQKVFDDSRKGSSFTVCAWVTVSQTYSAKRLLIDILQSSDLYEDGDAGSDESRLGEHLLKRLKDKKYLIVLDDLWSIEAWDPIQRSFPPNNNGSKVLFTSRSASLGKGLCSEINTHIISGLSKENSWNLLQNKVFGGRDLARCPPELERFGREIAEKCDGLPLAIVVIGGILAKKDKTTEQWRQVARNLAPSIATNRKAYMETLALSYHHLPVHLKACFLYLGSIFPEDSEIPVCRLVWLLVAEGFFIQEHNYDDQQTQSSEVIVEGYLDDLVERSLVTVTRKRSCGATKTIRIHDLLRDFCLERGMQEKFILKLDGLAERHESKLNGQRRLLVRFLHLYRIRSTTSLRSLFCDQSFEVNLHAEVLARCFGLVKVLQVDCNAVKFPKILRKMAHLRYLALLSSFHPNNVFTSSVTKLLYLETLFIHSKKTTDLPDDIWNLVKLRHLYNKNKKGIFHFISFPSQGANKSSSLLPNLQTLHTLCACKSCLIKLERIPNLKKLGLLGSLISESGYPTIPDLGFLEQLVTLKVTNNSFSYGRSSTLFKFKLPASLRKLTLRNTLLKWEEISVLAELENLEVLKLLDKACADKENLEWETTDLEFPKLKYLKMRRLDIVKWDDQNLQCESLEVLVFEECQRLESIPSDLADLVSLRTMEVTRCNTLVEIRAKKMEEEHETLCGDTNLQVIIKS